MLHEDHPPPLEAELVMRTPKHVTWIAAGILAAACLPFDSLWIKPGSTVDRLVFGLSHGSEPSDRALSVSSFYVAPMEDPTSPGAVWKIEFDYGNARDDQGLLHEITYGVVPDGFVEKKVPARLTPGCYVASTTATASVEFLVDADGKVHESTPDDDVCAPFRAELDPLSRIHIDSDSVDGRPVFRVPAADWRSGEPFPGGARARSTRYWR